MKRVMIAVAILVLTISSSYAMQQVALLAGDKQTVMLDARKVPFFGTIQNTVENAFPKTTNGAVDYASQNEPIKLRYISSEVLNQLVRDADHAPTNDDNSLTIESAKPLLDGAIYLDAFLSTTKYARAMAKLLVSNDSLRRLHEKATDHPVFTLSEAAKQLVYQYMPQQWSECLKVQHKHMCGAVAFSPDGTMVATGSCDKTALVVNAKTGNPLYEIKHNDYVVKVVFSPDSTMLATVSFDRIAHVMNAKTRDLLYKIKHDCHIPSVVFSPDSSMLATASFDNTARVMNAKTGVLLYEIKHDACVERVVFSPDGERFAAGSRDHTVRVVNAKTGDLLYETKDQDFTSVLFSPDGTMFAKFARGGWDKTMRVVNAKTRDLLYEIEYDYLVTGMVFSPDSRMFATGAGFNALRIVNAKTGDLLYESKDNNLFLIFSPDSNRLARTSGCDVIISENLTKTFDQALLAKYLLWCRENNNVLPKEWIKEEAKTFDNKELLTKTFPELKLQRAHGNNQNRSCCSIS